MGGGKMKNSTYLKASESAVGRRFVRHSSLYYSAPHSLFLFILSHSFANLQKNIGISAQMRGKIIIGFLSVQVCVHCIFLPNKQKKCIALHFSTGKLLYLQYI